MVCAACGMDNTRAHRFCANCGAELANPAQSADTPRDRYQSVLRREVVLLLAGIALVLAAFGGAWYLVYARHSPATVVREFIEADRAGRYADQNRCVSSRAGSTLILTAMQTVRQQTGASLFDRYKISTASEYGSSATVGVQVTVKVMPVMPGMGPNAGVGAPNRGSMPVFVPFTLVREEGEWKIDAAQTLASFSAVLITLGVQQALPNARALPGVVPPAPAPPPITTPSPPAGGVL